MKLFAIITAGLMAAAGGVYYFSASPCPLSGCGGARVACCSQAEAVTAESSCATACAGCAVSCESCCSACDLCCGASQAVAASCCGPKEECCIAQAACCLTQAATARKPIEITGCCDEGTSPARTLIGAAKSVAAAN